jgi:DNA-binding NarL/FixJ family response regulator
MIAPPMINRILNELPPPINVQPLSPDQIALLRLLAAGYSDSEILERRQMDQAVVQLAVQDIQVRLDCNSRLLAMLRAIQLGLIERPPAS